MRSFLSALLLAVLLLTTGGVRAAETPAAAPVAGVTSVVAPAPAPAAGPEIDWLHVLTKTAVYESLSGLLETGLFLAFYGGTAHTAGGVFVASLLSSAAVYIAHEYLWEATLPADFDRADPTLVGTKTVGYRILSTARSFVLGTVLGGAGSAASGGFALTMAVLDSGLYALSELAFAWRRPAATVVAAE